MRPRLLDLFSGAGGCARGYQLAGFHVTGVDHKPQPRYAGDVFVQADALEYLEEHGREFDAIHASPPCQAYIQRNKNLPTKWPRLIEPTRSALVATGKPYVIENVSGAALMHPRILCGTMFGLRLRRHRQFECSFFVWVDRACRHRGGVAHGDLAAVYGRGGKGPRRGKGVRDAGPLPGAPSWEDAMGIDWMSRDELTQAIPPVFTEYLGRQLFAAIGRAA